MSDKKYYIKVFNSSEDERYYFLKYDKEFNDFFLDDLHQYEDVQSQFTKEEIIKMSKYLTQLNFKNLIYIEV